MYTTDKKDWRTIAVMGVVLLTLTVCTANIAQAGETTSPPMRLSGGLICDTLDQAKEFANNYSKGEVKQVNGCGRIVGTMQATVTMLNPYQTSTRLFPMARFDILNGKLEGQAQYGWFGPPLKKTAGYEV